MNTDKVREVANEVKEHAEKIIQHGVKLAENPKKIGIVVGSAVNNAIDTAKSLRSYTRQFFSSVVAGYKEVRHGDSVQDERG